MCSPQNQQIVEQITLEFVHQGLMFTAKDVTDEAKRRGADERHLHMKNVVHETMKNLGNSDFERTLVPILNVRDEAFLYHKKGTDVRTYASIDLARYSLMTQNQTNAPTSPVPVLTPQTWLSSANNPVTPAPATPTSVLVQSGIKLTGNRLHVSSTLIKKIGLSPRENVVVTVKQDKVVVQDSQTPVGKDVQQIHRYRVNDDGRVRIDKQILHQADLFTQPFDKYDVVLDGKTLVITQA